MKYFIAITISVLFHILLYFTFTSVIENTKENIQYDKNKKPNISKIQYIQLKPKVIVQKPKVIPKSKPIIKPKVISKVKPKVKPKVEIQKKVIVKDKPKPKAIIKKVYKKPLPIQKIKPVKKQKESIDHNAKQYIDLYGDDFEKFDEQTKLFLINNIKTIASVTKQFLTYPQMSAQAQQDGINVVEFILYPNGSIKDVMISKSSGYFMLDDNTMETIHEAYEDYPRPQKPTLIKIFVKYELTLY